MFRAISRVSLAPLALVLTTLALRAIPAESRGWERDRVSVQCQSCQAISLFEPNRVAQRCEFCGSPAVVPYTKTRNVLYPESLLPFVVPETTVRESIRRWYGSRWFAPNRLAMPGRQKVIPLRLQILGPITAGEIMR